MQGEGGIPKRQKIKKKKATAPNAAPAIDIKKIASYCLIGIILGAILTFVPISSLVGIVVTLIALLVICVNGWALYQEMSNKKESSNDTLLYVIGILLGFILLCFNGIVINVLVALYLIGKPMYVCYKEKWDKNILMENVPFISLGVILIVSGISTFDIVFKILGVIVLIGSLVYLGINYYFYRKSKVKIIK